MIAFKAAIAATAILVFTVVADAAYAPLRTADDDAGSGPAKMRKIQLKERPLVNSVSILARQLHSASD